jgi:hypothetical protein
MAEIDAATGAPPKKEENLGRKPMNLRLAQTAVAFVAMASLVPSAKAADKHFMSTPRDTQIYSRPAIREDFRPLAAPKAPAAAAFIASLLVVDPIVNNTDPSLKNDSSFGFRGEISIAAVQSSLDSIIGNNIVLTDFEEQWGATAPLWLSSNGGTIWSKNFTINVPPGSPSALGCPCDQTVDFNPLTGALAGVFLGNGTIFSALSSKLTISPGAFNFFTVGGVAQTVNHLVVGSNPDQPWLLTGGKPGAVKKSENVYVAYDDFNGAPDMRVAVGAAASPNPLQFTIDNRSGFSGGAINPGHRLAVDPNSGAVYSLFQNSPGAGAGGSMNINYMLNRSTDGGVTWGLNGNPAGIIVANADSTQPQPKFCTVNALLGGVDHAAVDPKTGDVVYVYGNRDAGTGNNRLAMRRLTSNGAGGLNIGPELFITGQVQAAIPSVAITTNRTIGVFYYTCDGVSLSGFPIITAHFSTSTDLGNTFFDNTLESFLSPAMDNGNPRQRVLGDYQQVKAIGNTFLGGFAGNRVGFYPASPLSITDPVFFKVQIGG